MNNAGIGHVGTALTTTGADLDRLYAVNVRGMLNVTKVLPARHGGEAQRRHRQHGVCRRPGRDPGAAGLRDDEVRGRRSHQVHGARPRGRDGVRINCICPGRVETPWVSARVREYPDPEKAYREMAATQAMGRMGKPEEIAAAALYLASDEASFVTGSAFAIDGGWKG